WHAAPAAWTWCGRFAPARRALPPMPLSSPPQEISAVKAKHETPEPTIFSSSHTPPATSPWRYDGSWPGVRAMAKQSSHHQQKAKKPSRQWRRMDLHLHTPASSDYQEPYVSYLDILRQAEIRGLDIIALTDHN